MPERVFGRAARISMSDGVAMGPRSWRTWSFSEATRPTPWDTPREKPDEQLEPMLEALVAKVKELLAKLEAYL